MPSPIFVSRLPGDGPKKYSTVLVAAGLNGDLGRAERRIVTPGRARHDTWIEIEQGLRAGDRLIADPTTPSEDGDRILIIGEIVTDPLPDDFPNIAVLSNSRERMEPGLTMIEALRRDRTQGYLIVVDERGEVIWYMPTNTSQAYITRLQPDGLILTPVAARKVPSVGTETRTRSSP